MDNKLKITPLNTWHRENHGNMADFGGFDMPLWYSNLGVKKEHLAVLKSVGIFDTSHMACIMVNGDDAFKLLQLCFSRDLAYLKHGKCGYGVILNNKGHVIDDAIVYCFNKTDYMVCVNAGMGGSISQHFKAHKKKFSATIIDLSEKLAKIDIQGKNSAKTLSKLLKHPELVFDKMPYFSFKGHFNKNSSFALDAIFKDKTSALISRSGYTGEFGFEIFVKPEFIIKIWHDILNAGKEFNIIPCGLGARDSLRTGAVLPLSHQDIGNWEFINNPWIFALPFDSDKKGFTKDFIGKKALCNYSADKFIFPFAGENLRKIGTGKDSMVIDKYGSNIGYVLSCATDMGISWHKNKILSIATPGISGFKAKGISCGFVKVNRKLDYGENLLLVNGNREIQVTVLKDIRPDRTARKKISTLL